jgi:two-component system, OmpR family, alkaline phosphatase synthesis response regulator PhoP
MAKILAADDEPDITRLIQVVLQKHGHEVIVAVDGKEALEKVASEKPDLVLLDVMMPHLDGFEVLAQLQQAGLTETMPVIMLTAKRHDADIFAGWRAGAEHYLTKPFNPAELANVVGQVLAEHGTGPAEGK